jgi:hypothetical protein
MQALRKLLSCLFWPLRVFGYAADAYQLWSHREWILSVGGTAVFTGLAWIAAYVAPLPRLPVYLVVAGALLLAFWALIVVAENRRARRAATVTRPATQRDAPGPIIIERIHSAYFGHAPATQADTPKEVVRLENTGPVLIRQWAPQEIDWHHRDIVCVVPYKPYRTESAFFDAPAVELPVGDTDDVFRVIVDYEVKGENVHRPDEDEDLEESIREISGRPPIQLPVNIEVAVLTIGENARVVRELHIHSSEVEELGGGSWQHVVHANEILSGLPEGHYGLNVCDYLDAPFDLTRNEQREYRNMRLRVTRQQ